MTGLASRGAPWSEMCLSACNIDPHCLIQNVTGQLLADDWVGAIELVRWRLWRERSAWARGARWCRRLRSVIGRPNELRTGGSSTSCARRRAGIANMRCARSGNAGRLDRARSRHQESGDADMARRSTGVRQAAQGDDPDNAAIFKLTHYPRVPVPRRPRW